MLNLDRRLIKNFDWVTLSVIILISLIGVMTIYSATRPLSAEEHSAFYMKQVTWLILGLITLFLIVSFDYIWISRFALILYITGIILLGNTSRPSATNSIICISHASPSNIFIIVLL